MQEKINTLSERRDAGRIEVGKSRAGAVRKRAGERRVFTGRKQGTGRKGVPVPKRAELLAPPDVQRQKNEEAQRMRLEKVQKKLREKGIAFGYTEEDGCGSIDFEHRGLTYHIWEFSDGGEPCGAETNIRNAGRTEELEGDYEEELLRALETLQ